MAKDSKSDIDPRFDAAFQRGFDPSIPIEEYVPPRQPRTPVASPPQPNVSVPSAATPAVAPTAAPAAATPVPTVPEAAAPVAPETTDGVESVVVETAVDTTTESSLARNPFLLFLGIIAIALIALGVWLFVRTGDAFNSSEVRSQGDYMSLTATIDMAPFVALLGAATAIGVLFVFAARWKRRR